jgi:hypothetical protein
MAPKWKFLIAVCLTVIFPLINPAPSSSQVFFPFETIAKGEISSYSYGGPGVLGADMVITDLQTWEWFWKQHTQGLSPAPPPPFVDFRRESVLAVLLGYQTSGGGPSIEIRSIEAISNNLSLSYKALNFRSVIVHVKENRRPGPLTVITNPFHIIKINRGHIGAVFHHEPAENPGVCQTNLNCGAEDYCAKDPEDCPGNGVCSAKPQACIQIYDPVCGCDLKTYGNACEAARNGMSFLYAGPCR